MQRVLALLGLIAIGFVLLIGLVIGSSIFLNTSQIADAEAYSTDFLEEYGEEWNISVLQTHASPELLKVAHDLAEVTIFFETQFGTLESIEELSCPQWQRRTTTETGTTFYAACRGEASFTQRRAQIDMIVRKRSGEWKVDRFFLHSIPETKKAPSDRSV